MGNGASCRLIVPMMPLDAPAWLAAQTLLPKIYWHARRDSMVTAAIGEADRCVGGPGAGYGTLRAQLDAVVAEKRCPGALFRRISVRCGCSLDEVWQGFPTFLFTLPRFVYMRNEDRGMLACNLILPRDLSRKEAVLSDIERLRFPDCLAGPASGGACRFCFRARTSRTGRLGAERWMGFGRFAKQRRHLEKVVLARRTVPDFPNRSMPSSC